jgi:hypothetical protein
MHTQEETHTYVNMYIVYLHTKFHISTCIGPVASYFNYKINTEFGIFRGRDSAEGIATCYGLDV